MTSVTKVHLSVDTIFKFFLFFHKVTFSLRDSDRSDKRTLCHEQQGLQACDKRKPNVTKGVSLNLMRLLSHHCFSVCSPVLGILQGVQAFVTSVMSQSRGLVFGVGGRAKVRAHQFQDRTPSQIFSCGSFGGGGCP